MVLEKTRSTVSRAHRSGLVQHWVPNRRNIALRNFNISSGKRKIYVPRMICNAMISSVHLNPLPARYVFKVWEEIIVGWRQIRKIRWMVRSHSLDNSWIVCIATVDVILEEEQNQIWSILIEIAIESVQQLSMSLASQKPMTFLNFRTIFRKRVKDIISINHGQ